MTNPIKPAFRDHAAEIAWLTELCTCGHKRGEHMVGDGLCDVDGGCDTACQEFTEIDGEEHADGYKPFSSDSMAAVQRIGQ